MSDPLSGTGGAIRDVDRHPSAVTWSATSDRFDQSVGVEDIDVASPGAMP